MQILNLCMIFLFIVMAYISIIFRTELMATALGKVILSSFSAFWFLRMVEQIVYFGLKNNISILLTLIFLGGSLLYVLPALIGA